jgi:hypothetical protein
MLEFSRLIWSNCSSIHEGEHHEHKSQASPRSRNKFASFFLKKAMAHCISKPRHVTWHVTLDTVCHWTLPCKLVSWEFRLSRG